MNSAEGGFPYPIATATHAATRDSTELKPRRRAWLFFVVWGAIFLASASWALATPLGGSPDEPAHIIKAASVARGEFVGKPVIRTGITQVTVPADLADSGGWNCFAFKNAQPASCAQILDSTGTKSTITTAGLYNPIYYSLVGWPSLILSTPTKTVMAMRLISALISSFLMATGFAAIARNRRTAYAGTIVAAAMTPMVLFLNGAVNPNSFEYTGGFAFAANLYSLCRDDEDERMGGRLAALAISGILFANSRGLSPLWMATIGITAMLLARRGRLRFLFTNKKVLATLALLALAVVFALIWIFQTNTLNGMGTYGSANANLGSVFMRMFLDDAFDAGLVGTFGWLDTPAPELAIAIWWTLALLIVGGALVFSRGRRLVAVIFSSAVFLLMPALVQTASIRSSGFIWQGRYTLVAFLAVLVTGAFALDSRTVVDLNARSANVWRRVATAVGIAVMIGETFAVLWVLRRYAVGMDSSWGQFVAHPLWTPAVGFFVPFALIIAGTAGLLVVLRASIGRFEPPRNVVAAERPEAGPALVER